MKFSMRNLALFLVLFVGTSGIASAHQPRTVEGSNITVTDPEISKAYYAKLDGEPHHYQISATEPFDLYVNILVPDIEGQKKDISVMILKDGSEIAFLNGLDFEWIEFFEPFGYDHYLMGPEYKESVEAGEYEIRVWSSNNDSKYSLAIGEIEAFDVKETLNALSLVPELKRDFFNESPISFILSPFGLAYILVMFVLAFVIGFLYRAILIKVASKSPRGLHRNIGESDRILRLALCIGLLLWAITTSWSPFLLFFSGFTLFEAIFSWCGFYAALGKNTCPLN